MSATPETDRTHRVDPLSPDLAAYASVIDAALQATTTGGLDHEWTAAGGYTWQWSTPAGRWTVTAGERDDPWPLLSGPAGQWRLSGHSVAAAWKTVEMLRAAGALPPLAARPDSHSMPCCGAPTHRAKAHNRAIICGGCGATYAPERAAPPPPPAPRGHPRPYMSQPTRPAPAPGRSHPLEAVCWRPGIDPFPQTGVGQIPVALFDSGRPGVQGLLMPDGDMVYARHSGRELLPVTVTWRTHQVQIPADLPTWQPDMARAVAEQHRVSTAAGTAETAAGMPQELPGSPLARNTARTGGKYPPLAELSDPAGTVRHGG